MPFHTVEIRWIKRGRVPDPVSAWYANISPQPAQRESRVDFYLATGDAALNVKIRQELVEFKHRKDTSSDVALGNAARGQLEWWVKQSLPLREAPQDLAELGWIPCRKARSLRFFRLSEEDIVPVKSPRNSEPVCQVELAQIHVADAAWWTLAMEADGTEADNLLRATAVKVLAGYPADDLTAASSMGYAALLQERAGR